jgi:hypothetical protein
MSITFTELSYELTPQKWDAARSVLLLTNYYHRVWTHVSHRGASATNLGDIVSVLLLNKCR